VGLMNRVLLRMLPSTVVGRLRGWRVRRQIATVSDRSGTIIFNEGLDSLTRDRFFLLAISRNHERQF
jgi:hypothetical protein